ncbi:MAG TPA: hypothetical protein PLD03_09045 [Thiomonas arsenitoxydans]|nr:hypothetical protein [Thiomonas arsenitoxydans]
MQFTQEAQCNAGQPHNDEATSILMHLLRQDAGGVVLTTQQFAKLLKKSEAGLRLAESRYRSRHGRELLPEPLMKNADGRIWSIAQVAHWLVRGGAEGEERSKPQADLARSNKRVGRPRKAVGSFTQQVA